MDSELSGNAASANDVARPVEDRDVTLIGIEFAAGKPAPIVGEP